MMQQKNELQKFWFFVASNRSWETHSLSPEILHTGAPVDTWQVVEIYHEKLPAF